MADLSFSETFAAVRGSLLHLWERDIAGISVGRVLLVLAILGVAYLLRRPVAALVLRQIRFMLKRTNAVDAEEITVPASPPAGGRR